MPRHGFFVLILSSLMNSGCLTSALWNSADPDERVWVSASVATDEQLNEKGLSYTRYRFRREHLIDCAVQCDAEVVEGFLVERTEFQRLGDAVWRIAATPFTFAFDACGCVFVTLLSDPDALRGLVEGALTCAFN